MPIIAILLIVLALTPFAVYFSLKRPMIFPFGLYLALVPFDLLIGTTKITLIVEVLVGAVLLFNIVLSRRVLAPPKSWTAWALYTLLASLTALWSIDSLATMNAIGTLLQLFVFFTIVAVYPAERDDVRFAGWISAAAGVLLSVLGLLSYVAGFRTQENRLSINFSGILIDPNHIAASLLLPIALSLGALLESRSVLMRLAGGASATIMCITIFLTGSRGGLIALAVMLLYFAWKTRYRLQILALMGLAGVGSLMLPTVWDRFADKGLVGGSGRLFIWNAGSLALKDHWLTGAGLGAFPAAYNHELLAMYQPIFQGWSRPAHNALLSAAVELGLLGAALLVYATWRSFQDAKGNVVIEAGMIGLIAASQFLDVMLFKYIWLLFTMAVLVKNAAEPHFLRGAPHQRHQIRRLAVRPADWRARQQLALQGRRKIS